MSTFAHQGVYSLESGESLHGFNIEYKTLGKLNSKRNNVVWVCHALTANAEADDWWEGLIGNGQAIDPAKHFIVCANMLGSCYGSTHALSINPDTQHPYYHNFPILTNRDIVGAMDLLRQHLSIEKIQVCIGGSMGGQQAIEWAIIQPDVIENLVLLATNARHSAWGIAFNESQRMAIENDHSWQQPTPTAGMAGLKVARSIALLSYRHYGVYKATQTDQDTSKLENFRATSYQEYQGKKLQKRFNAYAYWTLSKAMDSHNVGRGRGGEKAALTRIKARTVVIGVDTDVLFPVSEQKFLAAHIPQAQYYEIQSLYGHDGFLIETSKITDIIQQTNYLNNTLIYN
ncbi:homoserine O-acetyltransferase family protein [Microscilla marina]|uniref:Homoserine O-acetyltransferase n=1 Tax=Microscilla marina ATCC 23134 TaxID=313606 RepID=A1ZXT5_MICM2|nr:homoserine O-acetyltransferase [Microscilla marina]EAY24764.1 homoserine O-acetyltransferase [Microscilla marina ATCC 23134]